MPPGYFMPGMFPMTAQGMPMIPGFPMMPYGPGGPAFPMTPMMYPAQFMEAWQAHYAAAMAAAGTDSGDGPGTQDKPPGEGGVRAEEAAAAMAMMMGQPNAEGNPSFASPFQMLPPPPKMPTQAAPVEPAGPSSDRLPSIKVRRRHALSIRAHCQRPLIACVASQEMLLQNKNSEREDEAEPAKKKKRKRDCDNEEPSSKDPQEMGPPHDAQHVFSPQPIWPNPRFGAFQNAGSAPLDDSRVIFVEDKPRTVRAPQNLTARTVRAPALPNGSPPRVQALKPDRPATRVHNGSLCRVPAD